MPIRELETTPQTRYALTGCRILDTEAGALSAPSTIVIAEGRIEEILPSGASTAGVETIDAEGRVAVPGLIDSHAHPTQSGSHAEIHDWDASYHVARTSIELERMLRRGFTTVRDMGGAEPGLARAVREGLITGPRLLAGGPIFAPTGGHGLTRIVDGEVEMRRALREQFREGADHIKLTASGGVISKMRIDSLGFSEGELRAAVDEAKLAKRYIAAHVYTAEAVNRALSCGVRTIEHGTYLDDTSIALLTQLSDVHLVPTLAALWGMLRGKSRGTISDDQRATVKDLLECGLESMKRATDAGVSVGYGTDLHGDGLGAQLEEIRIRTRVLSAEEILRSLTINGASIVRLPDRIGRLSEGYDADILLVDADPRADLETIADESRPRTVITQGRIV